MLTFLKVVCERINILQNKKSSKLVDRHLDLNSKKDAEKITDTTFEKETRTDQDIEKEAFKENIDCDQDVSKNTESSIDFDLEIKSKEEGLSPQVILTDCLIAANCSPNLIKESKACLSDSRRSQRKSSRVAAGRIAKISRDTWQFDSSTPLKVKRERSKRLSAKVANEKIFEIIEMSPVSSDEDAEDEIEMDDSE